MAQMTQIMFRAFLKLVIGRNYLYLPTEIMNKGRAMHILLGSLGFGSQGLRPFPCAGFHVMVCGGNIVVCGNQV